MKTTLDIQDDLLAEAKAQAAHVRSSLTAFIEDGLRLRKPQRRAVAASKSPSLPVYRGKGGLLPGIDPTRPSEGFRAAHTHRRRNDFSTRFWPRLACEYRPWAARGALCGACLDAALTGISSPMPGSQRWYVRWTATS